MKNLAKRRIAPIFTAVVLGFFTSCSSPVEGQVTGFDETTETDVIGDRWEPGLADTRAGRKGTKSSLERQKI